MIRRSAVVLSFLAVLVGAVLFAADQYQGWNAHFQAECPNKDTLLWDANMRMLQAIDAVDDARMGTFWPAFRELISSPTWPPLRTLSSILILAIHGQPDTVLDMLPSAISLFILLPLFSAFAFFFRFELDRALFNCLLFFATVFLLFGLADLPQYVFSSMLEIQGMVFFTWNAWTIFLLYRHFDGHHYKSSEPAVLPDGRSGKPVSRLLIASFFLSGLGLYLTKYPYGILTGLSLLALEFFRAPGVLAGATFRALRERYRGWRLLPFALLGIAGGLILLGPHIAHDLVNTRSTKLFIYVFLLWIFLDFNHYLWRYRPDFFPASTRFVYLWFLLPFATVLLSHPDRFGSLIQAQTDRVTGKRTYLLSLFDDYFLQNRVFSALILGGLSVAFLMLILPRIMNAMKMHGWQIRREGRTAEGGPIQRLLAVLPERVVILPETSMILFLWCNIFVMEFLTSNHQARYLFQVLPLFIFFHGNLFWVAAQRVRGPKGIRMVLPTVSMGILALLAGWPLLSASEKLERNVCFAGRVADPYDGARRLAAWIPPDTDGILINDFHSLNSAVVGRAQATEIDLFLRKRVWGAGHIRTDSKYRYSTWKNFREVIHVGSDCSRGESEAGIRVRAGQVHADLERMEEYSDPAGLCAVRYRIRQL